MAVTERLRELRAEGKHELADTLAVEVLRNETPRVTVKTDYVCVETPTFVGEHALARAFDPADEEAVREVLARTGTYRLVGADGRAFTTGCLYDAVVDRLTETSTAPPAASSDATDRSDERPTPDPERDHRDDVDSTRSPETARTPTAVIREAVAAVQSQFRN